jgi:hypothetical protein
MIWGSIGSNERLLWLGEGYEIYHPGVRYWSSYLRLIVMSTSIPIKRMQEPSQTVRGPLSLW